MVPVCEATSGSQRGWFTPRAQVALMTCACAGASAFLYAVDPNRHAVYPQCLLHRATGLYCAGCGATRALYALLHGRVLDAVHDNALFVTALPFVAGLVGIYFVRAWRSNVWPEMELQPRAFVGRAVAIFVVMLIFMLARNLPGWPFEALRPLAG